MENGKAGSELTKRIDEAVVRSRKNSIWRSQYMKEKIVLQDVRHGDGSFVLFSRSGYLMVLLPRSRSFMNALLRNTVAL